MMEKKREHWVHCMAAMFCGLFLGVLVDSPVFGTIAIQVLFGGLISSLCTFFLEFCYRPGNIFGWYMDWLERNFRDNLKNPFGYLYKPMGGCAYCQNTWITLGFFAVLAIQFEVSWWLLLPTVFISHMFLTILDDLFWS